METQLQGAAQRFDPHKDFFEVITFSGMRIKTLRAKRRMGDSVADARESNERRLRRLDQMDKNRSVAGASKALKRLWEDGRKPPHIVLRSGLLAPRDGGPSLLSQLVLPKGIALRFYLVATFEAQCRLGPEEKWSNVLPLSGPGSWSDLFAADGAYDAKSGTYMPLTVNGRTAEDLRLRQVQGALRTLEGLGSEQYDHALVDIPRGKREQRLYQSFRLMGEAGRGGTQSPKIYVAPRPHWKAARIPIPAHFFLNGWAQVLNPSEVATWLVFRWLSKWAKKNHLKSGVYLHGERRMKTFGLRRDAWEDGCQRLRDFGLIRFARTVSQAEATRPLKADNSYLSDELVISSRERYEPYRYQVTDRGLEEDAVKVCKRELTFRQQQLDQAAKHRRA
ncbi:hypothetical protein [[Kitasatospora] papulosa]|uniref:hypothetical protein n=1 Tax=[Kitasatospora] papulosa TaxID=1464011 RepID=UPI0036867C24